MVHRVDQVVPMDIVVQENMIQILPGPPNILNQLVAALHDASLEGDP